MGNFDPSLPVIPVIIGPTAAGKSQLAMKLAGAVGATIVVADSRQVYRGFDVGTAKPSADDQRRVPHRGIDLVDPGTRFSAAEWASAAHSSIADVRACGRPALIVGGTGFYVRALVEPLHDAPVLPVDRRMALDAVLSGKATAELQRWCAALDPARAHLGRTQLLRAIETALLTGQRLSGFHQTGASAPRVEARYLVVDPGRELADRIGRRVHHMIAAGWLNEVRRLMEHVAPTAPAWSATGYDAMRGVVAGSTRLDEAIQRVTVATRQYAKRQRTWCRHQLPAGSVTFLNPTLADADERALAWWQGANG